MPADGVEDLIPYCSNVCQHGTKDAGICTCPAGQSHFVGACVPTPSCTDGQWNAQYGQCVCDNSASPYYEGRTDSCTEKPSCNNGQFNGDETYCTCHDAAYPRFSAGNCEAGECPINVNWVTLLSVGSCDCPSGTYYSPTNTYSGTCVATPTCTWSVATSSCTCEASYYWTSGMESCAPVPDCGDSSIAIMNQTTYSCDCANSA